MHLGKSSDMNGVVVARALRLCLIVR